jgi:hypothetical protein
MTETTYTGHAEDKRQGMTVGELRAILVDTGSGIPDDAKVVVRAGGRGQIKAITVTVAGDPPRPSTSLLDGNAKGNPAGPGRFA